MPNLPRNFLKKGAIDIHPTALTYAKIFEKAREHAEQCISEATAYNKERWDKTHREPKFQVGDQVLIFTANFNNLSGPKKIRLFCRTFYCESITWKECSRGYSDRGI
jgi:hypothetical protein